MSVESPTHGLSTTDVSPGTEKARCCTPHVNYFRIARDPTEASPTSGHGHPRASSVKFARRLSLDAGGNRHAITIFVYDRGMPVSVNLQTVHPRKLAAVRREVAPGAVGSAWKPALDKVWEFIRSQPGLRTDGHNIFLYHHPTEPGAPILCDFGVEVTRKFETAGAVYATETQGGEAAVAVHRGPYNRMNEARDAIGKWMAANRRASAGQSWEIYGDPTPDPADTETTVVYLLK
jgi:effector-binding domain-containing protein